MPARKAAKQKARKAAARPSRPKPAKAAPKGAKVRARVSASTAQKIMPFLWFDSQAEEAARFYASIFPDSRITGVSRYGEAGPGPKGSAMSVSFRLAGQEFGALNGGPLYSFTPAVSFFVHCKDQAEVDHYWDRLLDGGKPSRCGWLTDRYGLSWQVVPDSLGRMLGDKDPARSRRVMEAMLGMVKLDVARLEAAYQGR